MFPDSPRCSGYQIEVVAMIKMQEKVVIVKNSSPQLTVVHLLDNCWPFPGRLSAVCQLSSSVE